MTGLIEQVDQLSNEVSRLGAIISKIEKELNLSSDSEIEVIKRQIGKLNGEIFESKFDNTGKLHRSQ